TWPATAPRRSAAALQPLGRHLLARPGGGDADLPRVRREAGGRPSGPGAGPPAAGEHLPGKGLTCRWSPFPRRTLGASSGSHSAGSAMPSATPPRVTVTEVMPAV